MSFGGEGCHPLFNILNKTLQTPLMLDLERVFFGEGIPCFFEFREPIEG